MTPPPSVLIDTCSLIGLVVDPDMWSCAKGHFVGRVGTAQIVVKELQNLRADPKVGKLVGRVLADIGWLGSPLRVEEDEEVAEVTRIQGRIAGGRPLRHSGEHLGESALIVVARQSGSRIIIDDHDARVMAKSEGIVAISVHRLLHQWIRDEVIKSSVAKKFSDAMQAAGRGTDYTEQELIDGGRRAMGRVWEP
jgi:hypothetical protein